MFRPLSNRILCKLISGQGTTETGIILPESAPEQSLLYRVITVGPACHSVQADQKILLPLYAGHEIEIEGTLFTITREPEVTAIIQ